MGLHLNYYSYIHRNDVRTDVTERKMAPNQWKGRRCCKSKLCVGLLICGHESCMLFTGNGWYHCCFIFLLSLCNSFLKRGRWKGECRMCPTNFGVPLQASELILLCVCLGRVVTQYHSRLCHVELLVSCSGNKTSWKSCLLVRYTSLFILLPIPEFKVFSRK